MKKFEGAFAPGPFCPERLWQSLPGPRRPHVAGEDVREIWPGAEECTSTATRGLRACVRACARALLLLLIQPEALSGVKSGSEQREC